MKQHIIRIHIFGLVIIRYQFFSSLDWNTTMDTDCLPMSEFEETPRQGFTPVKDGTPPGPRLEPKENKYSSFKKSYVKVLTDRQPVGDLPQSNIQKDTIGQRSTSKLSTGKIWQSLVGQNVSGMTNVVPKVVESEEAKDRDENRWRYTNMERFYSNPILDTLVHEENSLGRLLLHIVVRNEMSEHVEDVAIGCYNPRIYCAENQDESRDCRVLWMAFRKSTIEFETTKVESFLTGTQKCPLENNKALKYDDIETVYGNQPPIETVFITEKQLVDRICDEIDTGTHKVFALLELFLERCPIEL